MNRSNWTAALLTIVLLVAGCAAASLAGDRYFEQQQFVRAEAAYRGFLESASSSGIAEARALYRLALIHSLEGAGLDDPQRTQRYFALLEDRYPDSAYALQARLLIGMRRQADQLRLELSEISARAEGLEAELQGARQELALVDQERAAGDRRSALAASELTEVRTELARLRERLAARETELERLKQIDLEGPPP